ncbi:MAG TPA: nitric-oxide reductase large subunit [Kofleriaceae bacterium]|nr:nitric-oxide reductase large subunit [Kofleriaceae bacterium]
MRRLWIALCAVLLISFGVLGWVGSRIYQLAPPIPDRVVTSDGRVVFAPGDISAGQDVWRSLGGMELGSIWGHGAYVAPDWTADWLHRELLAVLDVWARRSADRPYSELGDEQQAALRERLTREVRRNTYDATTGTITVSPERGQAIEANVAYYTRLFAEGHATYALPRGSIVEPERARALAAYFFWSAWAAATCRPGEDITYTSNWPHEPLIHNVPTSDAIVWTGVSILVLLAGIGGLGFWHAARRRDDPPEELPDRDPMLGSSPTPSQLATVKYFWAVCAMIVVQILVGVITAHYGVEGTGFYGIPLAKILPYATTRTWHVQLGIFWIATAWLAAGLALAPSLGGEPRGQRFLVNALFAALVVVVAGSLTGELVAVRGGLSAGATWWLGHSGYEYIDLGRVFQLALLVGLTLWVFLVARALWPALRRPGAQRPLLVMLLISTVAIGGFYFAALGAGRHTNLAIAEYWRWWVVHLWVEGFFEVFATVIIALMFARLGLVRHAAAGRASVLAAAIFLGGGVIGTLHHLYFSGTPTVALAFGAVFSALEVVPLMFLGYDAWDNWRHTRSTDWMRSYRWPIYFFIAVAFWNLVGAGLFGFMINPPIALYYMQGLNTTPVHGHTALFGVYGMLGMGLVLFTVKSVHPHLVWPDRLLRFAFWSINLGLGAMVLLSLLPVGLLQTWAAVEHGYWYARSEELLHTPLMNTLRWLRVIGDTVFAAGAIAFVAAIVRMTIARTRARARANTDDRAAPTAHLLP